MMRSMLLMLCLTSACYARRMQSCVHEDGARTWELENGALRHSGYINDAQLGMANLKQAMYDPTWLADVARGLRHPEDQVELMKLMADPSFQQQIKRLIEANGVLADFLRLGFYARGQTEGSSRGSLTNLLLTLNPTSAHAASARTASARTDVRRMETISDLAMFRVEHATCVWVSTIEAMKEATLELRSADAIAVDVEGDSLGHGGRAATVQLAGPNTCYIVDLAALGMPDNLRELLQSSIPMKVCHGFTNDQINLIEQFNLDFSEAALFDTQVALRFVPHSGGKSVVDVLGTFTNAPVTVLQEMKVMKDKLRWVNFFKRPLPQHVARYACLDVVFLQSAFKAMKQLTSEMDLGKILDRSKYRGPWAKGSCYRPPSKAQRARQEQKGKVWCDARRDWVWQG